MSLSCLSLGRLSLRQLLALAIGLCWAGLSLALVNVNTATREELEVLKGIGPAKAQAIIDHRRRHGPFRDVESLRDVPGIGPVTFADLRHQVSVVGPTRSVAASGQSARPAAPPPRPAVPALPPPKTQAPAPAKPAPAAAPARPAAPAVPHTPQESSANVPGAQAAPARPPAPARPAMPAGTH